MKRFIAFPVLFGTLETFWIFLKKKTSSFWFDRKTLKGQPEVPFDGIATMYFNNDQHAYPKSFHSQTTTVFTYRKWMLSRGF